jgi:hypothetical protein
MDSKSFQRILSLTDTIHDFKSSSRGNLSDEEKEGLKHFNKVVFDNIKSKLFSNIPFTKAKRQELLQALETDTDIVINLEQTKLSIDEDGLELPYYIDEFVNDRPYVGNRDKTLQSLINLLDSPPKNLNYNPANLIEIIMLTYIHDGFRESIGLKRYKNYVNSKSNCTNTSKLYTDSTTTEFCNKVYFPTYKANSLFKVASDIENKMKVVTYTILNTTDIYQQNYEINWEEAVKDNFVFKNKQYVKICLGRNVKGKVGMEGIYKNSMTTQKEQFLKVIKRFLGSQDVSFAYDSNGLDNEWMKENRYKGLFVEYDSNNQDAKTKKPVTSVIPINKTVISEDIRLNDDEQFGGVSGISTEFQTYKLTKENNELVFIDEIQVNKNNIDNQYRVVHCINVKSKKYWNIDMSQKSKGLPFFLKFFNEINKKTLGYKTIQASADIKKQLLDGMNRIGIKSFKDMYKVTLTEIDPDPSVIQLDRQEFVKAIFDFKRAMDYLYVKAVQSANASSVYPDTKFIFVSQDKSAIWYSLFLSNPTIMTSRSGGMKYMELFNFPQKKTNNASKPSTSILQKPPTGAQKPEINDLISGISKMVVKDNAQDKTSLTYSSKRLDKQKNVLKSDLQNYGMDDNELEQEINRLKRVRFISPGTIKVDKKDYDLNDCDRWDFSSVNKKYQEIMKRICEDYKQKGGSPNNSNAIVDENELLCELIPLEDLQSIADFGSPFYIFLHFYSQLSPTIEFFWFVFYKFVFYCMFGDDMDKLPSNKQVNSPQPPRTSYMSRELRSISNNAQASYYPQSKLQSKYRSYSVSGGTAK